MLLRSEVGFHIPQVTWPHPDPSDLLPLLGWAVLFIVVMILAGLVSGWQTRRIWMKKLIQLAQRQAEHHNLTMNEAEIWREFVIDSAGSPTQSWFEKKAQRLIQEGRCDPEFIDSLRNKMGYTVRRYIPTLRPGPQRPLGNHLLKKGNYPSKGVLLRPKKPKGGDSEQSAGG